MFAYTLPQENVGVVEILEEASEERIAVGGDRFLDPRKDTAIHALRVVGGLEQVRGHTGDNHGFACILGTIFSKVASHLTSSHRETDQAKITQLEVVDQPMKIPCECVVIVACAWLAGLAETSAVVGNDPITGFQENGYLLLPGSTAQWVSVDQHNRLARPMVFVVKLDVA